MKYFFISNRHNFEIVLAMVFLLMFIKVNLFANEIEKDSLSDYKTPNVTVTADRAILGKTPVPFSELTQKDIKQSYIMRDVPELLTELPSIISYSESGNNIGYSYLTLRGFDQHRISVFVNGIPQNDPEDHNVYWIDMPDIASNTGNLQVQRGAGIVNYGAASIGGSINLVTSNFANKRGIKLFSGIGFQKFASNNENFQQTMSKQSFEISSGMVKNYAFYGRLSRINSNGYRNRMWTKLNSYFLSAARFDKNFTTQINIFGGPLQDGLGYTGLPKSYIENVELRRLNPSYWEYDSSGNVSYFVDRRKQESEEFSQPHYELLNDWNISDSLIFHSSLFFYTGYGYYDYDGSWADATLKDWVQKDYTFSSNNETFKNSLLRATVSNKQGGWIPRLLWKHNSGELSVGAEIRIHRSEHFGNIIFSELLPEKFDPDYKFYSYDGIRNIFSLFASEHYNLTNKLSLNLEGQIVNQTYALSNIKRGNEFSTYTTIEGKTVGQAGGELFNINYLFFNPRLGFNYLLDDNMNLYALLAYTSREPRMKNLYSAEGAYYGESPMFVKDSINGTIGYDFTKPLVKPESMLDFELGWNVKKENYNFNANFYLMEYFDELVSTGIVDVWGRPVDGNVPRTRHIGLELQASALLYKHNTSKIILSANTTISRNRIVDFNFVTLNSDTVSLNGNPIAGFPDIMGGIKLSYLNDNFYCSLTGKYVGEFRTDNYGDLIKTAKIQKQLEAEWNVYNDNILDPYFVLNADLSYTFENILSLQTLKIQIKVNNILDNLYAANGIGKAFFPAAERNFIIGIELGL